MDEIPAESITTEGTLAEERLSLTKSALQRLRPGFSFNPTFGNLNKHFQFIRVPNSIDCCFVHVFAAVQSRNTDVAQTPSKNWETNLSNGTDK